MKFYQKLIIFFLIITNLIFFSGCWDYREINKLALIAGFAIDKDVKSNKYIITVEVVNPMGGGQGGQTEMTRSVFSAKGDTVFQAIRDLIPVVSKRSYWAHSKVAIISQDIAKEDMVPALDLMNRDPELRSDIDLLISRDKTAREILDSEPKLSQLMSFELDDTLKSQASLSEAPKGPVWQFVNDLSSESTSGILPAVRIKECSGKLTPDVTGSAVFKGSKLVGWLDGIETRGALWLQNKMNKTVIALDDIKNTGTKITMELFYSKTKLKPSYSNGKITMNVNIDTAVDIGEVEGSFNYSDEKGQDFLKKETGRVIQSQIEAVLKKAQNEFQSDIFGFGETIEKHDPKLWNSVKDDWDENFASLETQFNIKVSIIGSALMAEPIKVGK